MQNLSLLNSIVGPVMRGPSSSHSAAPFQMAGIMRQMSTSSGESICSARVTFDPTGSFAAVYKNQGSDEGFAAGLLGTQIDDQSYQNALPTLETGEPFPLAFLIEPLTGNDHPNRVEVEIQLADLRGAARTDTYRAVSTGGGMFTIDHLNRSQIGIDGSGWTVLIERGVAVSPAQLKHLTPTWPTPVHTDSEAIQFVLTERPNDDQLRRIACLDGVERVRVSRPTQLPVVSTEDLITSAADLSTSHDPDLASKALEMEAIRLGVTTAEARDLFSERLRLMLASAQHGFAADRTEDRMRFLTPTARRVRDAAVAGAIGNGFLQNAMAASLAVMEQSTNRGIVVAAPTAGSAGIVPGALHALAEAGASHSTLVDSLQVMALVGGTFAVRGSFAAETGGCAVETGASAAMAAAGITYVMGGGPKDIFRSASLCLMNTLGLVCDPVAGEVEIPCHARNIAGVSHAQAASIATLAGFDAVMPFDDMVQATVNVGKLMHPDLRCTGRGGCAEFCPSPRETPGPVPVEITRRA